MSKQLIAMLCLFVFVIEVLEPSSAFVRVMPSPPDPNPAILVVHRHFHQPVLCHRPGTVSTEKRLASLKIPANRDNPGHRHRRAKRTGFCHSGILVAPARILFVTVIILSLLRTPLRYLPKFFPEISYPPASLRLDS